MTAELRALALASAALILVGRPGLAWDAKTQGGFVMSLAADGHGRVWAGTEDQGVWCYDPTVKAKPWTQFTTRNGLGDDNGYALTVDRLGRVWVGHLRHGVSVFNGKAWRNYDVVTGPLGERVYSLACAPNGDVWIATSGGLTRWVAATDRWLYYTTDDGLPSNQTVAVACNAAGDIYVGTDCDGLAVGQAADGYRAWRAVRGPTDLPWRSTGRGLVRLHSGLVNALLVTSRRVVYVGTDYGLGRSVDGGRLWEFVRGREWEDRVRGVAGGAPSTWRPDGKGALAEDYITALAEDADGRLWVGYRQQGLEVFDGQTGALAFSAKPGKNGLDPVRAILPRAGEAPLVAWYGGGVTSPDKAPVTKPATSQLSSLGDPSPLPTPAAPPDEPQLAAMLARLSAVSRPLVAGAAAFLGEDWTTQGDWMGRYGRHNATLCAVQSPRDHTIGFGSPYRTTGRIGPHHKDKDSLRYWVHWLRTDEPKTLWDPILGYRRQADWDDHGEDYAMAWEGPDVWAEVTVPAGLHRVSLYFYNKDGHEGANRWRDYLVECKPPRDTARAADLVTPLAHCRVRDFWGPKYVQFLVGGPARYDFKVGRNGSFNTVLQAIFVDKLQGPRSTVDQMAPAWMGNLRYGLAEREAAGLEPPEPKCKGRWGDVWAALENGLANGATAALQRLYRVLCYRAAAAADEPEAVLGRWRWRVPLWTAADRTVHDRTMAEAWRATVKQNPFLAKL